MFSYRKIFSPQTRGDFHSTGVNFRKFPWANGTNLFSVENGRSHNFVRLEFFDGFADIEADRKVIYQHHDFLFQDLRPGSNAALHMSRIKC